MILKIFHFLVLLIILVGAGCADRRDSSANSTAVEADQGIAKAFAEGRSGLWVQSQGMVEAILPDDVEGDPHQRFILRLANGQTLLIAGNIAIAKRIDGLKIGDTIKFRGQYEWNNKGGVVHWTHSDPAGRHPGGWLEVHGEKYE